MEEKSSTYEPRMKPFRRKKRHEGKDWTPDRTKYEPKVDKGLYCKQCRRQIQWKKLTTKYEVHNNDTYRLWFCECGNMVREDNMTDLKEVYLASANQFGGKTIVTEIT